MSCKVHEGDDLLNADRGSKERIAQIYVVAGGNRVKVEELQAGDIGAAVKLKDVKTGNTLNGKDCDYSQNVQRGIPLFQLFIIHNFYLSSLKFANHCTYSNNSII